MLREIPELTQVPGERRRRWFASDYFDLIVWFDDDEDQRVVGFHLHYDRGRNERVFMWDESRPLRHHDVDDGWAGRVKMTSLITSLSPGGDAGAVAARFERECAGVDPPLSALVLQQLRAGG